MRAERSGSPTVVDVQLGGLLYGAVRVDPKQRSSPVLAAPVGVEAELAHERVPVAVDAHVVDLVRRHAGGIGGLDE